MIKSRTKFLFWGLGLFFLSSVALAHGGVQKQVGTIVVYLNQSPLSPLVGEEVSMDFMLRDISVQASDANDISAGNLAHWPVTVTIADTYPGDESQDKVIYTKKFITDSNGAFVLDYTFTKSNYFDIDLHFKDTQGRDEVTGFLVQPRDPTSAAIPSSRSWPWPIVLGLGIAIGLATVRIPFKKFVRS